MSSTTSHPPEPQIEQLLRADDVGRILQVSLATLARWRQSGAGPSFLKLERGKQATVRYRRADVEAFLAANCRSRTRAGGAT